MAPIIRWIRVDEAGGERMWDAYRISSRMSELLLSWMAMAQTIERHNLRLNAAIVRIVQTFTARGFCSCLLKG